MINFSQLSAVPINCYVELSNATVTGGIIRQADFKDVTIEGGTFDYLSCMGKCTISKAVAQNFSFDRFGDLAISDTVLCKLSGNGIENALADGQQLSTLTVRNGGGVTAINGRDLPLSVNTIYLVGNASAELTLNTDVFSINGAAANSYNEQTYAEGTVLHITGNNDGKEILVNQAGDPSNLKPLRITEEGLPDRTGVTPHSVSEGGVTGDVYEGLGWQYAEVSGEDEDGYRTMSVLILTSPDGSPVNLTSDTINPHHATIASDQIVLTDVTVAGIQAGAPVIAQNAIIEGGTFQKSVQAYGEITGGQSNATVQLNSSNAQILGGVFNNIKLPDYYNTSEGTVIQNAVITGSLMANTYSKAAVSNTVSCGYIESKYLAAGQQQSKLMMTDGTVERLNDYAAATDAVYLIGNVKAEIRFSNTVTNINGAEASNYNEGTSAIDRSLTITAKNDGEPIVVNMAATGKLPFSSLSKSDFDIDWSTLVPGITCKKDGVGKLSLVYVRTSDNKVFATYPPYDEYGVYKQRIVAQEGDKYTEGSLDIGEVVRKYTPSSADFAYDSKTQTATYNGKMYFDDAPLYSIQYGAEDGSFPSVTKPTKAGTYSVYIVVNDSDHYVGNQYEVGTYTVSESKYTLTVDDKSTEHVAGEKLSFTADEKDGYTFTGWKVTGLPTDVDTTKATISFTMPANNVTLKAQYTENAPETYELKVTDAKVTLKDGSAVADLKAVPVGTELVATAAEKDGYTFTGWEVTGLPTDVDTTKATISFTMPANKVTLKAQYTENAPKTYKLDVSDATVTLKDGGAVADLTAVPVDTELKVIADEDTETSVFKNWSCTGLELTEEQSTAHVLEFKMPAQDVKLTAVFEVPATPDPDPTPDPKPDPDPDPEPTPDPKPDPNPDPDPTPDPKPDPNPDPDPTPDPKPDPNPDPDPTPDPKPDPTPDPEPTPDPKPNPNPDPTPAPGGDSDGGGAIVMVAAVGSAAIGAGAYIVGTTAYLKSVLPEGMAIPANRQQLAVALWTAAGKPATQSTALFNDVAADAAELQAIRWVVETGLMTAQDGNFKPGSRVGRLEVIRTWKNYQQRG